MNSIFALFFLQGETSVPAPPQVMQGSHDRTIFIVAGVVVLLLLGFWVALALRPQKQHRHHHRPRRPEPEVKREERSEGGGRRRRRRRREGHSDNHLPRNPTLAETGGLPPIRPGRSGPGRP